jgi:hypothetical protein
VAKWACCVTLVISKEVTRDVTKDNSSSGLYCLPYKSVMRHSSMPYVTLQANVSQTAHERRVPSLSHKSGFIYPNVN